MLEFRQLTAKRRGTFRRVDNRTRLFRLRNTLASFAGNPASVLDDLPFQLAAATLAFRRFSDQTLRDLELDPMTPGSATVLHVLDETDSCTVQLLVERTRIANGTLTGLLDTLEDDGLLRRIRNPDDGRSWIIRLSAKGRRLCAKLHDRHKKVMDSYRTALSEREAAELKRLLKKLTSHMVSSSEGNQELVPGLKLRRTRR